MIIKDSEKNHILNNSDFITSIWFHISSLVRPGPVANVPVDIKIINNNVVSIWFDPTKIVRHRWITNLWNRFYDEGYGK